MRQIMSERVAHQIRGFKRAGIVFIARDPTTHKLTTPLVLGKKHGKWSIPKGHLDPRDHSIYAGAVREAFEEIGLKPPRGSHPFINVLDTKFYVVRLNSMPKLVTHDHQEVAQCKWFSLGTTLDSPNVYVKILNMLTKNLVYWYYHNKLSVPGWFRRATCMDDFFTGYREQQLSMNNTNGGGKSAVKVTSKLTKPSTEGAIAPLAKPLTKPPIKRARIAEDPPKQKKSRLACSRKWRIADIDEADGKSPVIRCTRCKHYQRLHLAHDDTGDYVCSMCGGGYSLCYFCYHCRRREDDES